MSQYENLFSTISTTLCTVKNFKGFLTVQGIEMWKTSPESNGSKPYFITKMCAAKPSHLNVADGFWIIDTTQTNYIEITELDLINKRVTGKFDLHFRMKTQGSHGVLYSERINFKSGDFRARIE